MSRKGSLAMGYARHMLRAIVGRLRFARAESRIRCVQCRTIIDGPVTRRTRACSDECAEAYERESADAYNQIW